MRWDFRTFDELKWVFVVELMILSCINWFYPVHKYCAKEYLPLCVLFSITYMTSVPQDTLIHIQTAYLCDLKANFLLAFRSRLSGKVHLYLHTSHRSCVDFTRPTGQLYYSPGSGLVYFFLTILLAFSVKVSNLYKKTYLKNALRQKSTKTSVRYDIWPTTVEVQGSR